MAVMYANRPQLSLAVLLILMAVLCGLFALWAVSPFDGEANILGTAIAVAFAAGLLTHLNLLGRMASGAAFIVLYLLTLFQPDPSGLGPIELVMPIQLAVAVIPMALSGWFGGWVRRSLIQPSS